MASKRILSINLGLLFLGIIIAGIWIYISGGAGYFSRLLLVRPGYFALLFGITAFCILSRFVRWQFLLRSLSIRIPTKSSLSIFLASLFGILTPAYVGEIVRGWFLKRKFGTPMKISTSVWVIERLLDVTALATIGLFTANVLWVRIVMLLIIAGSWTLGFLAGKFVKYFDMPQDFIKKIFSGRVLLLSFVMSLIAWLPTALLISVAANAMDKWVTPLIGMHIYSTATVLGGITLMPAGVGAMGSSAILQLQNLGFELNDCIAIVSIVRLTSTGASLAVASIFLFLELIVLKPNSVGINANHFNKIALQYKDQFSNHVWGNHR